MEGKKEKQLQPIDFLRKKKHNENQKTVAQEDDFQSQVLKHINFYVCTDNFNLKSDY